MSKKIKVIELIHGIVDAGAETILKDYILAIDKSKFDVSVLATTTPCLYSKSANVRMLMDNGIKIYSPYPIVSTNFFNKVYRKIRKLIISKAKQQQIVEQYVEKIILSQKPDIIHMHMQIGRLIHIADKLKDTKLIYSCYSIPTRYFNETDLKEELDAAKYLVAHNQLQFTAMHTEMCQELNRMFEVNDTIILRNAINIANFQHLKKTQKEARELLGIPCSSFVIGHVGRMFYIKNQLYLVDIFAETLKMKPNAFLLLVGDGEDRQKIIDKLEAYALHGKYKILSNIDNLNIVYKSMDVFVFPSILEGLPNVCIEAQATGLPCLISSAITKDVCASSKAIQMDISKNPTEWANVIVNSDFNTEQHTNLSEFDINNVIKGLENIYSQDV